MLQSLHISNYALIDNVNIDLNSGFNIITGETGAGKSIMLGALSLILGERADSKVIRNPEKKSIIEAEFEISQYPQLTSFFEENDIDNNENVCILRREITSNGRSRAFVNDTPVTLPKLQSIALQLVDIHSQHQNLLLSTPEFQLDIIDNLAGNKDKLSVYNKLYNDYRQAVKLLAEKQRQLEQSQDDEEFIRFQLQQIESLNLNEGEQEELEKEREIIANITNIKTSLTESINRLSASNNNILSQLDSVLNECQYLSEYLNADENISERLESAIIELKDISETLSDYDSELNADPNELENIEDRLSEIYSLQRKFHVNTISELLQLRDKFKEQINTLENKDNTITELTAEAKRTYLMAMKAAQEISIARKEKAKRFAETLKQKALPLGMKNLQCEINVSPTNLSPTGIDKVEFLFSFNKNQTPMPVGNTASGGEISRLMLSIKSIIAEKMHLPSIIFDEVDTGVSGDVANRMGDMMNGIANNIQVIAITHLPQVAAKGNTHYKVFKEDDDISTKTHIKQLSYNERIDELSIMLSGNKDDQAARANATSLLNNK